MLVTAPVPLVLVGPGPGPVQRLALERVLLTCDDDNIGSIRTIEKNGGVLENVLTGPDLMKPKRRYWIDTRATTTA